jgi:hypothetical protein
MRNKGSFNNGTKIQQIKAVLLRTINPSNNESLSVKERFYFFLKANATASLCTVFNKGLGGN